MRQQQNTYFPSLDGLRALSILLVIFHHTAGKSGWLSHLHGWLGVDVFFVLSGFLITFLLEKEKQAKGRIDLKAFYARRGFRILPVYFVMLGVYIVATRFSSVAQWALMKRDLPYFLTFLNEFAPSPNGYIPFGFSWTLGVEEKFYLFWPIFCFFVVSRFKTRRWGVVTLIGLYLAVLAAAPFRFQAARSYSGLLVGGLLALLLSWDGGAEVRTRLASIPAFLPLTLFVAGICLVDVNRNFLFVFSWTVALLVAHLATTGSWVRNFFSNPVLVWIGKRSYGMYLIHMLVLEPIQKRIHFPLAWESLLVTVCTFVVSTLVADGVSRVIENPAREFGKRWLERRSPRGKLSGMPANDLGKLILVETS